MQNYTVRPVLLKHKANENGMVTIRIAVTVDRRVTYMATAHRIHKRQWNEEKRTVIDHENADLINVAIRRKVAEIERGLITKTMQGVRLSKHVIKGEAPTNQSFYLYAKEVRFDDTEINRIKAFAGDHLLLTDITVQFLRKLEQHERARGMAQNTMNSTFKYIGRIVNQAAKEKLIKENPFDKFIKPRYKQTDRTYLTEAELAAVMAKLDEMPHAMYITACYFLLGCYTGLRNSDWRRFDYDRMVENDFVKLRAQKNGVHVVLPVGVTLAKVLERVRVLPRCFTNEECNRSLKMIALLAGINKNLTTHCARHSFGYMCASHGIPESTTAALIGVSAGIVKVYYHLSGINITRQAAVLKTL